MTGKQKSVVKGLGKAYAFAGNPVCTRGRSQPYQRCLCFRQQINAKPEELPQSEVGGYV